MIQNDDELLFNVASGVRELFWGRLHTYTDSIAATGGIKLDFTGPAGSSLEWTFYGLDPTSNNATQGTTNAYAHHYATGVGGDSEGSVRFTGFVDTIGAVSGNVQLRWANGVADGNVFVGKGSWLFHQRWTSVT